MNVKTVLSNSIVNQTTENPLQAIVAYLKMNKNMLHEIIRILVLIQIQTKVKEKRFQLFGKKVFIMESLICI